MAVAILLVTGAVAQEKSAPEPIAGATVHRIDEPVFGREVAVYEAGRGNPRSIVLVHGIGQAGARDYRRQIDWLRASFHVVALDLPGFGASDKGNALYTPTNYAGVVKRVADRFVKRPFVLVGHSMGAVVSLRYAATYPDDVERLVVIDAPGVLHRLSSSSQFLAFLGMEFVPPVINPSEEIANFARRILAPLGRIPFDPEIILASAQLRQTLLGGDATKISGLAVAIEDLRTVLPRITAPTLVVWGGKDQLAPVRNGRVLALKLPRAQLEVIDGVAHEPMIEAPERLRSVLEPFLELGLAPAKAVRPRMEKHGDVRCSGERGRVFEGEYDRLTIEDCGRARIRNARVRELRVLNSSVTIDDSRIGGGEVGLTARESTVVVTGGRIEGEVAIRASGSRFDLAATEVVGEKAVVEAAIDEAPDTKAGETVAPPRRVSVVFSLCEVRGPATRGELHGFYSVTPEKPL